MFTDHDNPATAAAAAPAHEPENPQTAQNSEKENNVETPTQALAQQGVMLAAQ